MKSIAIKAYAKINFCLDVKAKSESSEYHEVDTIMQTIDLHDTVILTKREDSQSTSQIIGADIPHDNAKKAADLFTSCFETTGVDIQVVKRIPIMSGLGGSSTNAAAVLKGMALLYNISSSELLPLAKSLGSDTPFFLKEGLARCKGYGGEIERLDPLPNMFVLVITDTKGVSTKEAYDAFDNLPRRPAPVKVDTILNYLYEQKDTKLLPTNSLLTAAQEINPMIIEQLRALSDKRAIMTTMTGSGSAVFSIYTELEDALDKQGFLMFDSEVYRLVY